MTLKKMSAGLFAIFFTLFVLSACVHSRPAKPGPNFIWVETIKKPNGNVLPGHWVHKGKVTPGKVWVKGHRNQRGRWIPGHWK